MKKVIHIEFNTELLAALGMESSSDATESLNNVRLSEKMDNLKISVKHNSRCDGQQKLFSNIKEGNEQSVKTENFDFIPISTQNDSTESEDEDICTSFKSLSLERGKSSKNLKTHNKIKKNYSPISIKTLKLKHKPAKQKSEDNLIDVTCELCLQSRISDSFRGETSHTDVSSSFLPNEEPSKIDSTIVNIVCKLEESYSVENSFLRNCNISSSKAEEIERLKRYLKYDKASSSNCNLIGSDRNNYLNGYSAKCSTFTKTLNELCSKDSSTLLDLLKFQKEINDNKTVFIEPSADNSNLNRIGMVLKDNACRRLLSAGVLNFKKLCDEEHNLMFNMIDQCLRGDDVNIIKIVEDCDNCKEKKRTTLHQAIIQKNVEKLFCLVKYHKIIKDDLFEINNRDEKRFTPLDYALELKMDKLLIDYLQENSAAIGVRV